ncbi:tetratricopeptide repeat-containing sensor histidine kinase [Microbacter margulisiae]|uniref:Tetratricopeptide (TPR) repeat protein n=1 Tax=Microbacter margulisiae TaxID=1350067 RepID=A0A7W5DS14_9PORP|nr:histidine kinase [Microbacter margulisiae]MBB3187846.1 tetratricopeptide (TPR) repeat protein [Microbacter margulisiae]
MKFLYIGLLILVFEVFSCTHPIRRETTDYSHIDSLVTQTTDSLDSNPSFVAARLRMALHNTQDSASFYKLYVVYIDYYLRVFSLDTASMMAKRLLRYANEKPLSFARLEYKSEAYNALGNCQSINANLDSALVCYRLAYKYAMLDSSKVKVPDIAVNLGDMYTRKGNFVEGISFYRRALYVSDSLHMLDRMGFPIYFGLAQAYFSGLRNFTLADTYFNLARKYYDNRTLFEKFVFCNNRGNFCYYRQQYRKALPWFLKAKALVEPDHILFDLNLCNANLGDIYLKLSKLDSASYYENKAYAYFRPLNNITLLYYIATVQAGIALKRGHAAEASQWLKQYPAPQSTEPDLLSLRNKCWEDYYVMIGNYKQAFAYQTQNMLLNDSVRAQEVNSRIAEIELRFRQDSAILQREYYIHSQKEQIKALRLTNYIWILLSIIIVAVAALFYFYTKKKKDLQRIRHQEQITRLRLQNIRNRVSPHFTFNVLNREISTEEDKQKHQSLFSLVSLLRQSLAMTEQVSVSLAEEIGFVKAYIALEKHRLGEDFATTWHIDDQLDMDQLRLPSMMVQIPVENAIKHALTPKPGKKLLSISITRHKEGALIVIQDNGAGYYPGQQRTNDSTGTGLKVLYQTIQLLNAKNREKIVFSVMNIPADAGTGTKVEIYIPEHYVFE